MRIQYNVTKENRKDLVEVISQALQEKATYQGMPTASYQIENFTVTKDGALEWYAAEDTELEKVLTAIQDAGFEEQNEEQEGEDSMRDEDTGLTIEMPIDKVNVGNLTNLLHSKGSLIRKALGVDDLKFEIKEDRIAFPWFKEVPEPDEVQAYTKFISLLCKLTTEQKRVSPNEHPVTNEKYTFRCFLMRLGFIGPEFKTDRKILLQNLSGNSAFKSGKPAKEVQA